MVGYELDEGDLKGQMSVNKLEVPDKAQQSQDEGLADPLRGIWLRWERVTQVQLWREAATGRLPWALIFSTEAPAHTPTHTEDISIPKAKPNRTPLFATPELI